MTGKVLYSLASDVIALYPERVYQGETEPYGIYKKISDKPTDTKSGASTLDVDRWQIDIITSTYAEGVSLADSLRSTIDRYRGVVMGVTVDKIVFEDERDMYDDKAEKYMRSQDYFIRIKL